MAVRYACQRCGSCCRWPGIVKLREEEIEAIARFLCLDADAFIQQYTELRPDRRGLTLRSRPGHECIFLEGVSTCLIQEVKPQQCRDFPTHWNFPGWRASCAAVPVEAEHV